LTVLLLVLSRPIKSKADCCRRKQLQTFGAPVVRLIKIVITVRVTIRAHFGRPILATAMRMK